MKLDVNYKNFVAKYSEQFKTALLYPRVVELKRKKIGLEEAQKLLKNQVPRSTLYFWWSNRATSLPYKDFLEIKRKFFHKDIKCLASLVGHILGDGGIGQNKMLHYCNTEVFLIEEFQKLMKVVFDARVKIYRDKHGSMHLRYGRKFSRALLCLFGEFANEKTKKITPQIRKMPIWWKARLLQALYDDDGSVPRSRRYKVIALKQKNKNIILWAQKTMRELGINSRLIQDGDNWHLRVTGYMDLVRFRDKINFSKGYRKQTQLATIIDGIKFPHWKTKNKIIELLKQEPKTRRKIAAILKINQGVIYGHLHGWKRIKRKSNFGLIDSGFVKVQKVGRINLYRLNKAFRSNSKNF